MTASRLLIPSGVLALLLLRGSVPAHEAVLQACAGGRADFRGEFAHANGTISEGYDRNGDGRVDVDAVSAQDGLGTGHHTALPFLYIVDLDFDGEPDVAISDLVGDGGCAGLRVYQDLRTGGVPPPALMNK